MLRYKHLFFDLDHTLWDFNTNCRETLYELYDKHRLSALDFSAEAFFKTYKRINDEMWAGYHLGTVTKEEIRNLRFLYTFQTLGHTSTEVPTGIDEEFLTLCPAKGHIFPYTLEMLEYLKTKGYEMHIITNGFRETQQIKISTSGLSPFFTHIIESDVCGFKKPDIRIFDLALSLSQSTPIQSIMIGDDLNADILGARNAGMDQIFINRDTLRHQETITHEITCLSSLKEIL
jgi:putative hydrolase of the HAD superfamily